MKKQASARRCFVCGVENPHGLVLKFYEPEPGETEAEVSVPEDYQGYPGVAHGGVIAAMLDEAAARAFLGPAAPRFMVTARLTIRYRRPVPVGVPLLLKGHAREDRGRVAVGAGELFDGQGNLLAEAEVVLSDPGAGLPDARDIDPSEWQVYPDKE